MLENMSSKMKSEFQSNNNKNALSKFSEAELKSRVERLLYYYIIIAELMCFMYSLILQNKNK